MESLRHGDIDIEAWILGHGDMDMETWTWRHGHEDKIKRKTKKEAQTIFLNPFYRLLLVKKKVCRLFI